MSPREKCCVGFFDKNHVTIWHKNFSSIVYFIPRYLDSWTLFFPLEEEKNISYFSSQTYNTLH